MKKQVKCDILFEANIRVILIRFLYVWQLVLTRRHVQELARNELSQRLLTVFDIVNTSIDHVPPAMYEYEVR